MASSADAERDDASTPRESGFGIVEVLVAMALLLIVAVSMLPVFISSLKLSADNVSLTTATQLVSEQMDLARALAPTCDAVQEFADEVLGRLVEDPRGTVLEITMDAADTCPTSYPSAFKLTVTVTEQGSSTVIAEAETRVMISSDD
jgi:type II secretory pathway pseudopilin PulG